MIQPSFETIMFYAKFKKVTHTGLTYYYNKNMKLLTAVGISRKFFITRNKILKFAKSSDMFEKTRKYENFNSNFFYAINLDIYDKNIFSQSDFYFYKNIYQLDIKGCYWSIFKQLFEIPKELAKEVEEMKKEDRLKLLGSFAKKEIIYKKNDQNRWEIMEFRESPHRHLFFVLTHILSKINKFFITHYRSQLLCTYCDSIYISKNTLYMNMEKNNFKFEINFLGKKIAVDYSLKQKLNFCNFEKKGSSLFLNFINLDTNKKYYLPFSMNNYITF